MSQTPIPNPSVDYKWIPEMSSAHSSKELERWRLSNNDYHGQMSSYGLLEDDPWGGQAYSISAIRAELEAAVAADEIDEAPVLQDNWIPVVDFGFGPGTVGIEFDPTADPVSHSFNAQAMAGAWIINLWALYRLQVTVKDLTFFHRRGRPDGT